MGLRHLNSRAGAQVVHRTRIHRLIRPRAVKHQPSVAEFTIRRCHGSGSSRISTAGPAARSTSAHGGHVVRTVPATSSTLPLPPRTSAGSTSSPAARTHHRLKAWAPLAGNRVPSANRRVFNRIDRAVRAGRSRVRNRRRAERAMDCLPHVADGRTKRRRQDSTGMPRESLVDGAGSVIVRVVLYLKGIGGVAAEGALLERCGERGLVHDGASCRVDQHGTDRIRAGAAAPMRWWLAGVRSRAQDEPVASCDHGFARALREAKGCPVLWR